LIKKFLLCNQIHIVLTEHRPYATSPEPYHTDGNGAADRPDADHLMHSHLIMLARMYGEMNDNDNALKTDERNLQLTFFSEKLFGLVSYIMYLCSTYYFIFFTN